MFKKFGIALVLFAIGICCKAQEWAVRTVPALQQIVQQGRADTASVHAMVELGTIYILRIGTYKNDLDSALLLAAHATALSKQLKSVRWQAMSELLYANIYREQSAVTHDKEMGDKARACAQHAYDALMQAGLQGDAGYAALELTNYIPTGSEAELQQKITGMEKALVLLEKSPDKRRTAFIYQHLAEYYATQASYTKAITAVDRALVLFKEARFPDVQGVYDLLNSVYASMGDAKEALRYGLMAAQVAVSVKDSTAQLSTIYNHIGITYFQMQQFDAAAAQFKKGVPIAERLKDSVSLRFLLGNIANAYMRSNRVDEALAVFRTVQERYKPTSLEAQALLDGYFVKAYLLLHQEHLATPYIRDLESLSVKMTDLARRQGKVFIPLVNYYFATGEYAKANDFNVAEELLNKLNNDRRALMESYRQQFRIDSARQQYVAAINHYQQYSALKDSLLSDANTRQIIQMAGQFKTEKKDHEIRQQAQRIQLLTKQAQLQKTALKQDRFMRRVMLAGVVILLLLLASGFNRYRLKRRSRLALENKQAEITRQNIALQELMEQQEKLLGEKEWMMKEIHHRVKNNLQIAISLLNTQSAYIQDDRAFEAIRESRHRIQVMSLIHQKLYQGENMSKINMPDYFQELIGYLKDSFNVHRNIYFQVSVLPVKLDASQAVPLGLILNETVTNAIKYAFMQSSGPEIFVLLEDAGGECLRLMVADNGRGVRTGYDLLHSGSFGMELITTLTTQLAGELEIDTSRGVKICVTFSRQQEPSPGKGS